MTTSTDVTKLKQLITGLWKDGRFYINIATKKAAQMHLRRKITTNQNWISDGVVAPRIQISHSVYCFIFHVRHSGKIDPSQPWHIRRRYVDLSNSFNKSMQKNTNPARYSNDILTCRSSHGVQGVRVHPSPEGKLKQIWGLIQGVICKSPSEGEASSFY